MFHGIFNGAINAEVEQQYHTANKRLAIAKRIAGSSKQPDQLVKSTELLKSELEAVEEAQHAAKAYTLMVRLFAKVIDRVSDAVAEREVQKSIRPELVSSIGCQTLGDQYLAIRSLKLVVIGMLRPPLESMGRAVQTHTKDGNNSVNFIKPH